MDAIHLWPVLGTLQYYQHKRWSKYEARWKIIVFWLGFELKPLIKGTAYPTTVTHEPLGRIVFKFSATNQFFSEEIRLALFFFSWVSADHFSAEIRLTLLFQIFSNINNYSFTYSALRVF